MIAAENRLEADGARIRFPEKAVERRGEMCRCYPIVTTRKTMSINSSRKTAGFVGFTCSSQTWIHRHTGPVGQPIERKMRNFQRLWSGARAWQKPAHVRPRRQRSSPYLYRKPIPRWEEPCMKIVGMRTSSHRLTANSTNSSSSSHNSRPKRDGHSITAGQAKQSVRRAADAAAAKALSVKIGQHLQRLGADGYDVSVRPADAQYTRRVRGTPNRLRALEDKPD